MPATLCSNGRIVCSLPWDPVNGAHSPARASVPPVHPDRTLSEPEDFPSKALHSGKSDPQIHKSPPWHFADERLHPDALFSRIRFQIIQNILAVKSIKMNQFIFPLLCHLAITESSAYKTKLTPQL